MRVHTHHATDVDVIEDPREHHALGCPEAWYVFVREDDHKAANKLADLPPNCGEVSKLVREYVGE